MKHQEPHHGQFNKRWKPNNLSRILLLWRVRRNTSARVYFNFKYSNICGCIPRKCSDHCCSSKGVIYSSVFKAVVKLPCLVWSQRGPHFRAFLHHISTFSRQHVTMLLFWYHLCHHSCSFLRSIDPDYNCNKCGQTSRLVVGSEIPTDCNYKASESLRNYILAFDQCCLTNISIQRTNLYLHHMYYTVYLCGSLHFLLHEDISHSSPLSISSTRQYSPRTAQRRKNSSEYSTIQKDSIQCIVGPGVLSGLLSSIWFSNNFNHCTQNVSAISWLCLGTNIRSPCVQFIS